MSDTTPVPLQPRCTAPCSTCSRYSRILLAITCATLLCALVSAVLSIGTAIDDGTASNPKPIPSSSPSTTTAPTDPFPTPTPTEPEPIPTEPEPTSTPCNMFDPECSSGGSSGGTQAPDPTPTAPDSSDGSGGGNGSGGLFGGTTA
ncbi:hypothetical protein OG345_42155 (plasmid) [Streptomyces sp. NBC_01220]|uniref:hypothetical protein n=1 Tax=Streptomyces sp. NBC_01220 TaxID=2903781 RepID=UPI00352CB743|nr:hypothetical protein OG345_42155 [Streptomyces sp. NBC_01220]